MLYIIGVYVRNLIMEIWPIVVVFVINDFTQPVFTDVTLLHYSCWALQRPPRGKGLNIHVVTFH